MQNMVLILGVLGNQLRAVEQTKNRINVNFYILNIGLV